MAQKKAKKITVLHGLLLKPLSGEFDSNQCRRKARPIELSALGKVGGDVEGRV